MNYLLLLTSFFVFSLHAQEITQKDFPLIQPISLEIADTNKVLISDKITPIVLEKEIQIEQNNEQNNEQTHQQDYQQDSDKDGIADVRDECPDTSENFLVDSVGCPQTTTLKVNFKLSQFSIEDDSLPRIQEFADFLLENIDYQVIIYGHTSSDNNNKHNQKLSQNRADAIMKILIDAGVKLTRLTAIGMGSKQPIADNDTFEGRAQNRRIEIELLQ